jgi:peptidase M50B-like protein
VTPAPSFGTVLDRIGQTQVPLPAEAAVILGLVALVTVAVQEIWMLLQYANTIAHEGAHAIAVSAMGRTVRSVEVQGNGDGLTAWNSGGAAGNAVILFVGYLGPSVFGLGAAKLIEIGHSVAVLWLTLLLLVLLLFVLRNWFAFVPVLLIGGLIYLVARYGSVGASAVLAYVVAWFLLISGVREVLHHGSGAYDAGRLLEITHIWRWAWAALWLIGSMFAVAIGGAMLV